MWYDAVRCGYAILRTVLVRFGEHPYHSKLCKPSKIIGSFVVFPFLGDEESSY